MRRIVLTVLVVAAVGQLTAPRAQSKRFITEKDLFKFTWIADPQISPACSTSSGGWTNGSWERKTRRT